MADTDIHFDRFGNAQLRFGEIDFQLDCSQIPRKEMLRRFQQQAAKIVKCYRCLEVSLQLQFRDLHLGLSGEFEEGRLRIEVDHELITDRFAVRMDWSDYFAVVHIDLNSGTITDCHDSLDV